MFNFVSHKKKWSTLNLLYKLYKHFYIYITFYRRLEHPNMLLPISSHPFLSPNKTPEVLEPMTGPVPGCAGERSDGWGSVTAQEVDGPPCFVKENRPKNRVQLPCQWVEGYKVFEVFRCLWGMLTKRRGVGISYRPICMLCWLCWPKLTCVERNQSVCIMHKWLQVISYKCLWFPNRRHSGSREVGNS